MSLSSDIDSDTNLLGKVVGDLQSNVAIANGEVTGTLLAVTGYTGFSGETEEQSGHYLAVVCTAQSGDTITAQLVGSGHDPVTLDDDGILIARITNKDTQYLRFTATAVDGTTEVREYGLSGLTLAE